MRRYFLLLLLGLTISCSDPKPSWTVTEQRLIELEKEVEQTSLPVNLANLKSGDNDKLGEFEIKLNKTRKILNNEWKTDPNKIVINSYIKIMNLDHGFISYNYKDGRITKTNTAPKHIVDTFEKTFSCYSQDYWSEFNIENSVTFMWDTLETKMVVQIMSTR